MQGSTTSAGGASPAPIDTRQQIDNPLWYRDAVIYQLHVRGFFDSNDGIGDFRGLSQKHTSDQHPWFQAARRAARGTSKRNVYVWSDTDQTYAGVPIVFKDLVERSDLLPSTGCGCNARRHRT